MPPKAKRTPQTQRRIKTVHCADFVAGDQTTITYGYSATDVEHLITRVLELLQAGALFLPAGPRHEWLRAEAAGRSVSCVAHGVEVEANT